MWTSKEVSHPKQELLLISFCLFLYCCCLLFCCCFFYFVVVFFCDDITPVYFQWKITFWIKVLKWNFFVEIVSLSTNLPQQLSHSYSSVFMFFFFRFFVFVVFFWCLILLILKSLQELLLIMSFSQFHFFPVWMHIFMLSFFPFPAIFTFISRRHRGSPFGLTFYLDGMQDIRLSCCCEYKHKPGHVLGGRNGHFQFVVVEGAAPCYR